MKLFRHKDFRFYLLLFLTSLWGGVFFILPDFFIYPTVGIKGMLYTIAHWILVSLPLMMLLYLTMLNKYIFATILPVLAVLGACIGFYSFYYKATLTPMILDATLNNDLQTSMDVMPWLLFVWIALCLVTAIIAIMARFRLRGLSRPYLHLFAILVVFALLFSVSMRAKTSFYQHFPFSLYYNIKEYNKLYASQTSQRMMPDTIKNFVSEEGLTIVFVIGETLRADHLSLNGYSRETTPHLNSRENIISYPNIYSEYTYTNPSVAHIMTRADSLHKERAYTETSFVPLFKSSGFYTAWIANQEPAKSYVSFMKECDTLIYAHPEKSVYTYSEWLDGDLLPGFNYLNNMQNNNKLIIMHTIGSHWYYNNHYTKDFERFKPVTQSKIVTQNATQELINSYDNTVIYTDFFLDSVIETLTSKNAILIFLSDHGEALGEDGLWLHANDNKALRNPACVIWCSNMFIDKYPEKFSAIRANKDKRYRTDFLFHSILSIGKIPTKLIETKYDISNVSTHQSTDSQ